MSNVGLNYGIEMCVDKMYGNELCGVLVIDLNDERVRVIGM